MPSLENTSKKHILLVEDDPGDIKLIKMALKELHLDHSLTIFEDGEDAARYLRKTGGFSDFPIPDLILLDMNLPGKHGIDLLEEIRSQRALVNVAVVFVTSATKRDDIQGVAKFRARAVLAKPIDLEELRYVMDSLEGSGFTVVKGDANTIGAPRVMIEAIRKVRTGIPGFDEISYGGIPEGRTTLVSGSAGSGKTVFAMQFLVSGMTLEQAPCVFATLEERSDDILRNMKSFGWDLDKYRQDNMFEFVEVLPRFGQRDEELGCSLDEVLNRIEIAIKRVSARRVAIDSFSAAFSKLGDPLKNRRNVFRLMEMLRDHRVTSLITSERTGDIATEYAHSHVEEFVSDSVIRLHNLADGQKGARSRSIEILKIRGSNHDTQNTPLMILDDGLHIFPKPNLTFRGHQSSNEKISTGVEGLDEMLSGGVFRYSSTLVAGACGAGKTVLGLHFILEGAKANERGLYVSFGESQDQIIRGSRGFGWAVDGFATERKITFLCAQPCEVSIEEHFKNIRDTILEMSIKRVVVDSISALEPLYPPFRFQESVAGLLGFLKIHGVTCITTLAAGAFLEASRNPGLAGGDLSSAVDNIVLLSHVELDGQMTRAMTVVKTRGSNHIKQVREVEISGVGMKVEKPFTGVECLMTGSGRRVQQPAAIEHG